MTEPVKIYPGAILSHARNILFDYRLTEAPAMCVRFPNAAMAQTAHTLISDAARQESSREKVLYSWYYDDSNTILCVLFFEGFRKELNKILARFPEAVVELDDLAR
jgi:hypothetical protein